MPEDLKEVNIAATLAIGSETKKITLNNLCMSYCIARLNFEIKPFERTVLRLFKNTENEKPSLYGPIKVTVETVTQNKSDPDTYYAIIKFNGIVTANQGIVQSLHLTPSSTETSLPPSVSNSPKVSSESSSSSGASKLNSLSVSLARCHMCSQKEIPFWTLQNRTMLSKINIFGVTSYTEAMPRRDFCDYNLIRVIVCPKCYFASSNIEDFKKEGDSQGYSRAPFDKKTIAKQWDKGISERKKRVEAHLNGFFGDERSLDQALLSYDLATMTSDAIFSADKMADPRRRNYNPARQSISHLMVKAELLISNDKFADAEKALAEVITRIEAIFPFLRHEPSIRAGFLLGMLSLYFENYLKLGQYLTFLREFNKDEKIEERSEEYKELATSLKKLDEAYQNRAEYSKANLTHFNKPF